MKILNVTIATVSAPLFTPDVSEPAAELVIYNQSANDIFISTETPAILNKGFNLKAGEKWELKLMNSPLYAISSASSVITLVTSSGVRITAW